MDFIENVLGKKIEQLTVDDIKEYFLEPKVESDSIEYKSYHIHGQNNHGHKEQAVIKTICGMLNSEGGVIIWGAPVEELNEESEEKEYQGELSLITVRVEKDAFISKVSQSIIPMPKGVKCQVIEQDGEYLCLIEVQRSDYLPHRYKDRYWIRLDGQTKVAPHHYLEAMMKQVKYPNIELHVQLQGLNLENYGWRDEYFQYNTQYYFLELRHFIINFSGYINGKDVNLQFVTGKGRFLDYRDPNERDNFIYDGRVYRPKQSIPILYYGEPHYKTHFILIEPEEIADEDHFDLVATIGGSNSPLKMATFKVHLDELRNENLDHALEIVEDNQIIKDMHHEKGLSKDELLATIMSRENR